MTPSFELFDAYYLKLFQDRWPALKASLQKRSVYAAWLNPFANFAHIQTLLDQTEHLLQKDGFFLAPEFPAPIPDPHGLLPYYLLDGASLFAAKALDVKSGEKVLDLCAAPGGKTLVLAAALAQPEFVGHLVCNDRSNARRARLKTVLESYLPTFVREKISVTSHDAKKWCLYEPNTYDKILLDAPCSSEAHLIQNLEVLKKNWSPTRSKQLAQQQYTMLASAIQCLKPGGELIYSTCSISPLENDGVIERLLKKKGEFAELIKLTPEPKDDSARGGAFLKLAEFTEFGCQIFPDRSVKLDTELSGLGPIYFAKLRRI